MFSGRWQQHIPIAAAAAAGVLCWANAGNGQVANPRVQVAVNESRDLSASRSADLREETASTERDEEAKHRQREGTRLVKEQGYFRATGDRLTFHIPGDDGRKYQGLENLSLERIAKVMSDRHDHPEQLIWEVSGFFTEYRGTNFLYITHAVLKSNSRRRAILP